MAETLEQLAESLALGEGFQLGLLVVPDLAAADMAFGALQRLLSARLGRPATLARVCPPAEVTDPEALASAALDPLVGLPAGDGVILDASAATARTEPAWAETLRRLNARRNGFARQLGRALVLCLTPRLEIVLAQEAPDLWSIRGPRAEVVRPEPGVGRPVEGVRFEAVEAAGLSDGLRRIFPDTRAALPMLAELGYPPARLPLSDAADFWPQVLRGLDQGRLPGGIDTLIRRLAREYGDAPSVRRAVALLPMRVKVGSEWVRISWWSLSEADRTTRIISQPWIAEIQAFLEGPPGRRLGIVGRGGSGRSTSLQYALQAARAGRSPIFMYDDYSLRLDAGIWDYLATLPDLAAPTWQALLSAMRQHHRPDRTALQILPRDIIDLLPSDVLHDPPMQFVWAVLYFLVDQFRPPFTVLLSVAHSNAESVDRARHRMQWDGLTPEKVFHSSHFVTRQPCRSRVDSVPEHLEQALRLQVDQIVRVGPWTQQSLMDILRARMSDASARVRLVLEQPSVAATLLHLASLATTPRALLRWTERLLTVWPLPPPPEWTSRQNLAQLIHDKPEVDPMLRLGALLDGSPLPAENVGELLGMDIRPLINPRGVNRAALLERDPADPNLLRLTPEAALLRPSVAEALAREFAPS